MDLRTHLPHDDAASSHELAVISFHPKPFGVAVSTVTRTTYTLLVRHLFHPASVLAEGVPVLIAPIFRLV